MSPWVLKFTYNSSYALFYETEASPRYCYLETGPPWPRIRDFETAGLTAVKRNPRPGALGVPRRPPVPGRRQVPVHAEMTGLFAHVQH